MINLIVAMRSQCDDVDNNLCQGIDCDGADKGKKERSKKDESMKQNWRKYRKSEQGRRRDRRDKVFLMATRWWWSYEETRIDWERECV